MQLETKWGFFEFKNGFRDVTGRVIVTHPSLEKAIREHTEWQPITVCVSNNLEHPCFTVCIDRHEAIGEISSVFLSSCGWEWAVQNPYTVAHHRAFDRAAILALGLPENTFSHLELMGEQLVPAEIFITPSIPEPEKNIISVPQTVSIPVSVNVPVPIDMDEVEEDDDDPFMLLQAMSEGKSVVTASKQKAIPVTEAKLPTSKTDPLADYILDFGIFEKPKYQGMTLSAAFEKAGTDKILASQLRIYLGTDTRNVTDPHRAEGYSRVQEYFRTHHN